MSLEDISSDARDQLAALSQRLSEDPSTRKEFLRLTKRVNPNLPIPELDIEDRAMSMMSQADKRVQQMESKWAERDAIDRLKERRSNLLKNGFVKSEAEINEVERVMLDKGIMNHESAAEYNNWMKQAATPTPNGYNPNPLKQFNMDAFRKDPVRAAREAAAEAMNEIRRPNRPIGL